MKKIGELLIEKGIIDQEQLHKALGRQYKHGGLVGIILIEMGCVTEEQIVEVLAEQHK